MLNHLFNEIYFYLKFNLFGSWTKFTSQLLNRTIYKLARVIANPTYFHEKKYPSSNLQPGQSPQGSLFQDQTSLLVTDWFKVNSNGKIKCSYELKIYY
jgi:hypothetical protein